ncbi:MAG: aldo/keto reductase, partial [Opitutus sp.]
MELRQLGKSGLQVPVLSFGTATFGDAPVFKEWGGNGVKEATRVVDLCLDAGLNLFDSADIYSYGQAEEILGQAIKGRRDKVLISTKGTFRFSDKPDDIGSSRKHLTKQIEGSLK